MEQWFWLTLLATLLFGIQNFLYKISAAKKQDSSTVTFASMTFVSIASIVLFFISGAKIQNLSFLLWISLISGLTMVATSITKIEGLKHIPTNIFYPIIKASIAFALIASLFIFNETLAVKDWIGITLIIFVIYLVSVQEKKHRIKNLKLGLILAIVCTISNGIGGVLQKFAVQKVNYNNFLGMSYIYAIFISLIFMNLTRTKVKAKKNIKSSLIMGVIIGMFIFAGFLALLKALVTGPIGIISPITNLSFVIPIVMGALIYKEKLTTRKIIALILSIIAIVIFEI